MFTRIMLVIQVDYIDVEGDFPFEAIAQFAKKSGKEEQLNGLLSQGPKEIEAISAILSKGSITDLLGYIH